MAVPWCLYHTVLYCDWTGYNKKENLCYIILVIFFNSRSPAVIYFINRYGITVSLGKILLNLSMLLDQGKKTITILVR